MAVILRIMCNPSGHAGVLLKALVSTNFVAVTPAVRYHLCCYRVIMIAVYFLGVIGTTIPIVHSTLSERLKCLSPALSSKFQRRQ